jgi:hypothetical protein
MPIPFKLDYVIEKAIQPQPANVRRTLNRLAGVHLSAREAREVLPFIENHKWYVSERLGRDVGLRVAAIDYFENIYEPPAARPTSGIIRNKLFRTISRRVLA